MRTPNTELHATIAKEGYIFLHAWHPSLNEAEAVECLGKVQKVSNYEEVHDLTPRDKTDSTANSYSGNFGRGEFPFHTDFAHWFVPPRFLVLRCVVGASEVATRLLDAQSVLSSFESADISRALLQPRRTLNGRRALLRLHELNAVGEMKFRWDRLFTVPASSHSQRVCDEIEKKLGEAEAKELFLDDPGDTLIIDNWRMLHGRTAVPDSAKTRRIRRAYLSQLHDRKERSD